jgi:hypothetical protein
MNKLKKLTNLKPSILKRAIECTSKAEKRSKKQIIDDLIKFYTEIYSFKYLSGALSLRKFQEKTGRRRTFYFIGDRHNMIGECPESEFDTISVDKWLLNMTKYSPKFVDIFLETSGSIDEERWFPDMQRREEWWGATSEQGTIYDVENIFASCYRKLHITDLFPNFEPGISFPIELWQEYPKCPVVNGRVHFVDIRYFTDSYYYKEQILKRRIPTNFIHIITKFNESKLHEYMYLKYIKRSKIGIEFERSEIKNWEDKVMTFLEVAYAQYKNASKWTHVNNVAKRYQSLGIEERLSEEQFDEKEMKQLLRYYTLIYSLLLDLYTIARMFKKFNDKEHPYATNIIVYVGNAHVEGMAWFLENFMNVYTRFVKVKNVDEQCIDISQLALPLF